MAKPLLSSSDDDEHDHDHDDHAVDKTESDRIKVNKDYAVRYEERKKKQELSALREKYEHDSNDGSADSESDEEEDEVGDLLSRNVDARILTTLATIKARDPSIYSKDAIFFTSDEEDKVVPKVRREKKITLKEYQSKQLLNDKDPEEEEEEEKEEQEERIVSSYKDAQDSIKDELKRAFYDNDDDDNDDDGPSELQLTKREKSKEELEREDVEYREFLLQGLKSNPNAQQAMQDWISYSGNNGTTTANANSLSTDDRFLIDYIMNRGWIDRTMTGGSVENNVAKSIAAVEESEEEVERADTFEEHYNFRFESGDTTISTYPRHISNSLRLVDRESKRQREREAAKKRRDEERARREEELKRLKNLKREELMRRAQRLVRVSGTEAAQRLIVGEENDDDDGEGFDLEEHDKQMATVFDESYYEENDNDNEGSISPASDIEMVDPVETRPIRRLTRRLRKGHDLPGNIKTIIEEQLYKLDYEDRIGDLHCRFKYRRVPGASFGLSPDDILGADDRALNGHVSLKKLAPYRSEEQLARDLRRYGDKRRVWAFKNASKQQSIPRSQ